MPDFFMTLLLAFLISCGNGRGEKGAPAPPPASQQEEEAAPTAQNAEVKDFYFDLDETGTPVKRVLAPAQNRQNCFIVISKVQPVHLNVYEPQGADTVLLASYPACVAKNRGQKQVRGDNKTPESYPGPPFKIRQIQDASDWHHDFGDGRGSIPADGHWFLRLETPGHSGIGIHGSTNNRESLKVGRGSEGCIRLLDEDIIHLHDNYAFVGMKVIILPEDHEPLSFEKEALRRLFREAPAVIDPSADLPDKPETVTAPEPEPEPAPASTQEAKKTWPDSVKVKGTRQRLRVGPNRQFEIYMDDDGKAICPENEEVLPCLGEEGDYYLVLFQKKNLYINKSSVSLL